MKFKFNLVCFFPQAIVWIYKYLEERLVSPLFSASVMYYLYLSSFISSSFSIQLKRFLQNQLEVKVIPSYAAPPASTDFDVKCN